MSKPALSDQSWTGVPVPLNDPKRRFARMKGELVEKFARFLDEGVYVGGKDVLDFEQRFAAWCGRRFVVAVANGTDALELAARAVGIKAGDEVVCVANAGGYFTTACKAIGASPVYVDVDLLDAQIDCKEAIAALSDRTRAIVVTHLFGLRNDISPLRKGLLDLGRDDVKIIEDFAQAHGARLNDDVAGYSRGDVAAFSFYPTKNLGALGDAGAIATDDAATAATVRQLREYGWKSKYLSEIPGGRNSRMDSFQAMLLSSALDDVDSANRARREIFERYAKCLPAGWRLIGECTERFVAHLCILVAPDIEQRSRMARHLHASDVANAVHYPVLDVDQPAWAGFGRKAGPLENSYKLLDRILTIPCFPEMYDHEIVAVMTALANFKS